VLRRFNLGEADRVITFVTPDRGKVKAVARGVRRITSKMAGHLELFGDVDLMLVPGRQFDVITSARLRRHPDAIATDYDKLAQAYVWAEMLDKLTPEDEQQPDLFALARGSYAELGENGPGPLLRLYFALNLLGVLGYQPSLEGCVVCGSKSESEVYRFSAELGGIVDRACRQAGTDEMTVEQIKLWRLVGQLSLDRLRKLGGASEAAKHSQAVVDRFYDHLFGRRFGANFILKVQGSSDER
jgi:DNA repair protein RecO (recombination protein O)